MCRYLHTLLCDMKAFDHCDCRTLLKQVSFNARNSCVVSYTNAIFLRNAKNIQLLRLMESPLKQLVQHEILCDFCHLGHYPLQYEGFRPLRKLKTLHKQLCFGIPPQHAHNGVCGLLWPTTLEFWGAATSFRLLKALHKETCWQRNSTK